MSWVMRPQEKEGVLASSAQKRYGYALNRIADHREIWSLWSKSGWVLSADPTGRDVVPIWPHPDFAALCATAQWAGSQPKLIELDAWLERWIPGMEKDNRLVAVFATPTDQAIVVQPDRLRSDLEKELSRIE